MHIFFYFLLLIILLGIYLIHVGIKKLPSKLGKCLVLTGGSLLGFPVFSILHNLLYALMILFFGENAWQGGDEPVFFLMAVIVCPIGFLIGFIGTIYYFFKK